MGLQSGLFNPIKGENVLKAADKVEKQFVFKVRHLTIQREKQASSKFPFLLQGPDSGHVAWLGAFFFFFNF